MGFSREKPGWIPEFAMTSIQLSPAAGFFSGSLVRWKTLVTTIPFEAMMLERFLPPAQPGFPKSVRSYAARILSFVTGAGSWFYSIRGNTDA
jgi:hypothetical protein